MTQGNENQPYFSPVAPPTEPGQLAMPRGPSSWPTVVGIIAIVLAAGAMLMGVWGAVSPLFLDAMGKVMPPGQGGMFAEMGRHAGWIVASGLVSMAVAGLLLAGGIGLVKRRRWAIATCRGWAILKIIYAVGSSAVNYQIQEANLEAMSRQTPGMAAMPGGVTDAMLVGGTVIGLLWSWAFPVFVLIWLARKTVKAETGSWS